MEFKKQLKTLRKKKGVTQKEMGKVLHYGRTAIANYEAGRTEPSISDLTIIARYLGVTVDYLIGNTENKEMDTDIKNICICGYDMQYCTNCGRRIK